MRALKSLFRIRDLKVRGGLLYIISDARARAIRHKRAGSLSILVSQNSDSMDAPASAESKMNIVPCHAYSVCCGCSSDSKCLTPRFSHVPRMVLAREIPHVDFQKRSQLRWCSVVKSL